MSGGAIGVGARFAIGQLARGPAFPWATLTVNLTGALLTGVLQRQNALGGSAWLFLGTGVVGGFTTFSAFSLDAVTLMSRGAHGAALAYVATSVLCAFALFAGGLVLTKAAG